MADDNVFDFEAFRKRLENLKKEQEAKQKKKGSSEQDSFFKMLEMYNSLFTPPSQEEVDKAISQFADSLEKVAETLREMQSDTTTSEGEEDESETEGDEE